MKKMIFLLLFSSSVFAGTNEYVVSVGNDSYSFRVDDSLKEKLDVSFERRFPYESSCVDEHGQTNHAISHDSEGVSMSLSPFGGGTALSIRYAEKVGMESFRASSKSFCEISLPIMKISFAKMMFSKISTKQEKTVLFVAKDGKVLRFSVSVSPTVSISADAGELK